MALFVKRLLPLAALLYGAPILAQATAAPAKPACDAAEGAKGSAARATLSVNIAREATTPVVAANNLKNAVKVMETPEKGDDPIADAYALGTALSLWANQPGVGLTPKRGTLGFTTRPDATIDIPFTLDSLFRIVEAAKPSCSDYTAYWRAGQKFYLDAVNGAINSLNADKLDSAEYYAIQADRLYGKSPYGDMVLGGVYSKKNDIPKALQYWTKAAETAAADTSYRDVRRQMLANIANAYMNEANAATGPERVAAARKASEAFVQLLAVPGTRGSYVTIGRQNLQSAYLMAGDTAAAAKSWNELAANPTAYEYQDLLNSAVNAARANHLAESGKLFEATLATNPYSRDALYNVAVTYLTAEQNEKVGPVVVRLVAVDPGNPENYNLAARAYLAMAKAAEKAKNNKGTTAYNDSTITWYNSGNKLPIEVTFREFSPTDKNVTIAGTVLDRRDKSDAANQPPPAAAAAPAKGAKGKAAPAPKAAPAKSYPPQTYTLTFSALDKTGAVVGTPETVTTNSLQPGQTDKFTVRITGANIVAYKYVIAP
jgi:hypothetical protein